MFAITIIILSTFIGAFALCYVATKERKQFPEPDQPRWLDNFMAAGLITSGVLFFLTIGTVLFAIVIVTSH